jgi:hypothetical protein
MLGCTLYLRWDSGVGGEEGLLSVFVVYDNGKRGKLKISPERHAGGADTYRLPHSIVTCIPRSQVVQTAQYDNNALDDSMHRRMVHVVTHLR